MGKKVKQTDSIKTRFFNIIIFFDYDNKELLKAEFFASTNPENELFWQIRIDHKSYEVPKEFYNYINSLCIESGFKLSTAPNN